MQPSTGASKGFCSITINGNWRVVLRFVEHDVEHVDYLREYLPEGPTIGEVAKRLGVTRQALTAVPNGRAGVSAALALRLEGAPGTSAEMWL